MKPEFPFTFGLERLQELRRKDRDFDHLLQRKKTYFHIVGTNGKGSLSQGLAYNIRSLGFKVGLFTSPHLVRPEERIRINGVPISEQEFLSSMDKYSDFSFFEAVFIVAVKYFRDCDFVVLEAGMGGRLDATNAIDSPAVVCVTSIAFDHMEFLGHTLEKIASEKLAVIKESAEVFGYREDQALLDPLTPKKMTFVSDMREMIAQALASQNMVAEKVKDPLWAGRFHFIHNILVDGCHNPEGVEYFIDKLKKENIHLTGLGFCGLKDKQPENALQLLKGLQVPIFLIPELSHRALNHGEANEIMKRIIPAKLQGGVLSLERFVQLCHSDKKRKYGFVGSLYGVGALFDYLKISPWCP